MNHDDELPDPRELEMEAESMPIKVSLPEYRAGMRIMKEKGYSYAEVAEWISEKLGVPISRHQVAYVLNLDPAVLELQEREEHEERLADEHEEHQLRG